jgi:protein SCO1/2
VPIFVFIFIYIFGEHHFKLRCYFPQINYKGEVLYTEAGDTLFKKVPQFNFTDQNNKSFSQQDLKDKIYIVNFFSSDCSEMCRKMSSQLVRTQEAYQNNPTVHFVSISVKPDIDSASVLRAYAAKYDADTTRWHFLTGNRNEIYNWAQQGFEIPLQKTGGPEGFIHTDKFFLVDKEQKVRGIYEGTKIAETDRMVLEINVLLDEYSKSK